ncbi:MAG: hypothetical protein HQK79_07860 [Desulfobacterales bacterium]|nr:hypothetical protein [Desulfobacterales bacterium]
MRKIKFVSWTILLVLVGIMFFQNQEFFLSKESIGIDLMFLQYKTPLLPTAVHFFGVFIFGVLFSYFASLLERFRAKKAIKKFTADIAHYEQTIADLKRELERLSSNPSSTQVIEADTTTLEPQQ